MNDNDLTPEQREFLSRFADNGLAGRRILCFFAHCLVGLGMIGGAIAGIAAGIAALLPVMRH